MRKKELWQIAICFISLVGWSIVVITDDGVGYFNVVRGLDKANAKIDEARHELIGVKEYSEEYFELRSKVYAAKREKEEYIRKHRRKLGKYAR